MESVIFFPGPPKKLFTHDCVYIEHACSCFPPGRISYCSVGTRVTSPLRGLEHILLFHVSHSGELALLMIWKSTISTLTTTIRVPGALLDLKN